MSTSKVIIYCDGGARGNPGPAGIGAALYLEDAEGRLDEIASISKYIGTGTNNQAEYAALLAGLEEALQLGAKAVEIRADSELMIRQLHGQYRVKSAKLKPLYKRAISLLDAFEYWSANHVARELNRRADSLVNDAIDSHFRGNSRRGENSPN